MHRHVKPLCAGVAAVALLAMAVANASARHFSLSGQSWRITWRNLELSDTANSTIVKCEVTLEASFHSATFAKVVDARIGYVTRATVRNPCVGGTMTIHQEALPWPIMYRNFSGALPNIASIATTVTDVFLEIREASNDCSVFTHTEEPALVNVYLVTTTHAVNAVIPDSVRIALTDGSGGLFCEFADGILGGTGEAPTVLGSTRGLTVNLI